MGDTVRDILIRVCGTEDVLAPGLDLLESGLLDSLALIDLFSELEAMNVELNLTSLTREDISTVAGICSAVERAVNAAMR